METSNEWSQAMNKHKSNIIMSFSRFWITLGLLGPRNLPEVHVLPRILRQKGKEDERRGAEGSVTNARACDSQDYKFSSRASAGAT